MWKKRAVGLMMGAGLLCAGCGQGGAGREQRSAAFSFPEPPVRMGTPVGLQMVKTEGQLKRYPFFNLLSFEGESDAVFVKDEGGAPALDLTRKHTGNASLRLPAGTKTAVVKLDSLHSGREWPGPWTLVGAYFYAENPQRLSAALEVDGKPLEKYNVELPGGQWTPVLLDIRASMEEKQATTVGTLKFTFERPLEEPVWCDDVVEVNNTTTHVDMDGFKVTERGFRYILEKPLAFRIMLKTPEAVARGWRLEEASDIRVSFSSTGPEKRWTIYPDGRRFVDGKYKPLSEVAGSDAIAAAHEAPATIRFPGEAGRLDRNTAGDENNDGYNEAMGSYEIVASGSRLEVVIAPGSALLVRPVVEVRGLPEGEVFATMEGVVINRVARLGNGHVLVEIPGGLDRATTLNLKVSPSQQQPTARTSP